MFGISGVEFLFIAVLALLLFGPDKLPELGRTVGGFIRQFNEAKETMENMVKAEMYLDTSKAKPDAGTPYGRPASQPAAVAQPVPEAPSAGADFDDAEEEEEE